ncbi:MAG TPA: O-antigen ligase family protein [Candidatus Nanopelagicaceae bacterium]|nr:O-antigen ligase family protein [Candidatus Nanopelagicaceae bacterium]
MRARAVGVLAALIEFGWLALVLAIPSYFKVDDQRAFEPDKAILLRDGAALLGTLALLHLTLTLLGAAQIRQRLGRRSPRDLAVRLVRVLRTRPTLPPMLLLALVTLLATATSMLPELSWNGSYARGQGALTLLAYLVAGVVVLTLLRTPAQASRLGRIMALAGVPPAGYGWVQHFGHDPLPWQQIDLSNRVPGTLGNPIFLGAVLVMTIPFALWCLVTAARVKQDRIGGWGEWAGWILLWSLILGLQLGALIFTKSRGPFAGLLVGLAVFGLALARAWELRWLRRGTLAVAGLMVAVLLGANLLGRVALGPMHENSALRLLQWTPAASGTSEVRLDIWGPALGLIPKRPLLGCGPEALTWCYYPVYPTVLRHIEAPNAVPDRTHNLFLDAVVETGILGLVALLALLGVTTGVLYRLLTVGTDPTQRALAAALLAALASHVGEGFFGIPIVATDLFTWLIAGLAGALWAMYQVTPTPAGPVGTPRPRHGGAPTRVPRRPGQWIPAGLAGVACLAAGWVTWQVWANGAAATGADVLARQGANLTTAAQGNAGQTPLPRGLSPQPILALRQFSAAAADQEQALATAPSAPQREEYLLDLGTTLVNWAQDAGQVGGPAATQANQLYEQALADFGQAARLNPFNPDQLRDTGKAYERWAGLGHDFTKPQTWNQAWLERAALAFARAAVLAPHHPDPLTSWAEVALWQGQAKQAFDLSNQALAMDARDGDGYRLRAQAELALGQRAAALADWRRALANPTLSHPGQTAAQLALAEATWAHARCAAVHDARAALGAPDTTDRATMQEIVRVDGRRCLGA